MDDQPEEYFGTFSGEPSFKLKNNPDTRPTFILLEDFSFTDPNGLEWSVPKCWEVDGASIPKVAWSFIGGPMSGKYAHASIIHDKYCDTKERTAHDTHRVFYYGMKANGVGDSKAKIMYWAVRTFGPSWRLTKGRFGNIGRIMGGIFGGGLTITPIDEPTVPSEMIEEIMGKIKPEMSLSELDELSDSIRKDHGSEEIQQDVPWETVIEKMLRQSEN